LKKVSSFLISWHRKCSLSSALAPYLSFTCHVVYNLSLLVVMTKSRQKILQLLLRFPLQLMMSPLPKKLRLGSPWPLSRRFLRPETSSA
jgi:hypothetical protein